ncbi:MAG TPA: hypothetical protein VHM69_04165 [Rubrobacter sp.]|nr:hypothetical protein [Rubrobacter sp.]
MQWVGDGEGTAVRVRIGYGFPPGRTFRRCARQPGAPATPATATQVGACREAPVILTVDAAAMHAAGDLSGWPG